MTLFGKALYRASGGAWAAPSARPLVQAVEGGADRFSHALAPGRAQPSAARRKNAARKIKVLLSLYIFEGLPLPRLSASLLSARVAAVFQQRCRGATATVARSRGARVVCQSQKRRWKYQIVAPSGGCPRRCRARFGRARRVAVVSQQPEVVLQPRLHAHAALEWPARNRTESGKSKSETAVEKE